jgi:predicted kinase
LTSDHIYQVAKVGCTLMNLLIFFLIGCPSSGKSTLTHQLINQIPNYRIISTDQIRQKLFGDESIQGNWQLIEAEIFTQIQQNLTAGNSIIYDATNAKRAWRMALLQKLKSIIAVFSRMRGNGILERLTVQDCNTPHSCDYRYNNLDIIGLHLQTPLEICKQWNKQRQRQVPESIIESYHQALKQFPPILAEGFTAIYDIPYQNGDLDLTSFTEKITKLSRSKINRQNRTQHRKIELHRYSQLLDFDRLMHLISLILEYPGIGNLQQTDPQLLENILGQKTNFDNSIDEICTFITIKHHSIYADPIAIKQDLKWLEENGIIGEESHSSEIHFEAVKNSDIITHSYSDIEPFQRLIKIIRFIIHNPFLYNSEQGSLNTLVSEMEAQQIIDLNSDNNVRKDIEKILKPFRILPNFPMKKGYFAGTGILSEIDLVKVFKLLEAQAKSLEDPVSLEIYQRFQERIGYAQLAHPQQYPVRAIYNRSIVDLDSLPSHSLAHHIHHVESAIESGKCLELKVLNNSAQFTNEPNDYFFAFPLQIVFHNIGWYLGFEYVGGEKSGLFKFERLDRLCLGRDQYQQREHQIQYQALQKLQTLYQSSGGIFVGNNRDDQITYLSKDKTKKAKVEVQIELWFPDNIFRFIRHLHNTIKSTKML